MIAFYGKNNKMSYTEVFLSIVATSDVVLFSGENVLLIKRKHPPFQGDLALPGGHIDEGEKEIDAAIRELEEETSVKITKGNRLFKIGIFDKAYRDPRHKHVISYAYGYIGPDSEEFRSQAIAKSDAKEVAWVPIHTALNLTLAFDHNDILQQALYVNNE